MCYQRESASAGRAPSSSVGASSSSVKNPFTANLGYGPRHYQHISAGSLLFDSLDPLAAPAAAYSPLMLCSVATHMFFPDPRALNRLLSVLRQYSAAGGDQSCISSILFRRCILNYFQPQCSTGSLNKQLISSAT